MQQRLPKYYRTEASRQAVAKRQTSELDLEIIETIGRYHIIPTALLLRLIRAHRTTIYNRLQTLYHRQLVNRFYIPRIGYPGQNNYYLDNPAALDLLKLFNRDVRHLDRADLRRNKEKNYAAVNDPAQVEKLQGHLLFIQHELMISRFHGMLELACRESGGQVELVDWRQGPALRYTITAPKMHYNPDTHEWSETSESERLPVRPDAFFTLRFRDRAVGDQDLHFCYEADRQTTSGPTFARKLRAYHQFILRQKSEQHIERHFGVNRIRAVMTETLDSRWGEHLRFTAASTFIAPKPSVIFWFTTSTLFTKPAVTTEGNQTHQLPRHLADPAVVFGRIWATPVDDTLYSFFD